MKALFVDATNKTMTEIEIENDLHALYDKIGCRLVQLVEYRDELLVCDEEARLKSWDAGFQLDEWRIVSNALIVAEDEDGDFTETKLDAAEVARQIQFFGAEEPMPEPCFRVNVL